MKNSPLKLKWCESDFALHLPRVAAMVVLKNESTEDSAEQFVECTVRGWLDSEHCLRLEGFASLVLPCGVCHGPMVLALPFARTLVLKRTEAQADAVEDSLPEDTDAVVCGQVLNLRDLIEDELLLSLPMHPRHEHCPGSAADTKDKHRPFLALAGLLSAKP